MSNDLSYPHFMEEIFYSTGDQIEANVPLMEIEQSEGSNDP